MNKVYESDTMVVHDDRESLTIEQAFDILLTGKAVRINYPPDFSAEYEGDIYDSECPIFIGEIINEKDIAQISKEEAFKKVFNYLRGYEIYK